MQTQDLHEQLTAGGGDMTRGATTSDASPGPGRSSMMSRRRLLAAAGGGAGALLVGGLVGGVVGYEWPHAGPSAVRSTSPAAPIDATALTFVSRPDLRPPRVHVSLQHGAGRGPEYIFLAARTYISSETSQSGLMIIDRRGALVWFQPLDDVAPFDFRTQTYNGRPVLTWWQGRVTDGYGQGTGEMANASYKTIMHIQAGDGLRADLHELRLTAAGTVLLTAYEEAGADLSSVGGPQNGKLLIGHAQEIDLHTGRLIMDWSSIDHVGLDESYQTVPHTGPYDYFHINSIAEASDGDLIISARNTWAIYKVDRVTGRIKWRMNGKRSDFLMGKGANYYWQHDAEPHGPSVMTVFDDGASPSEEAQSRGLLLDVNEASRRVTLRQAFLHPAGFLAANQGNVQLLPDGRAFVGWGNQPYFSEFSPDGKLLLDGVLPIGYHSYRAFTTAWSATPSGPPAIAVRPNPAGGAVAYASWNGSTATKSWTVLAGQHPSSLQPVGSEQRSGFETEIAVNSSDTYYQVLALDQAGRVLGRSHVVRWHATDS